MSTYYHGVRVMEEATALAEPIKGTSGLQVVFGTAPVHKTAAPYQAVNKPILCRSFSECTEQLGYSDDFATYTLCQSMDACFRIFSIAPVIFVNVLDPGKHVKENQETEYEVKNKQAVLDQEEILWDSVVIKNGETILVPEQDYLLSDEAGKTVVTMLQTDGAEIASIKVSSKSVAPELVTAEDIIGGYDAVSGAESGIETVRQVYPKYGMVPGLLLAPGWSGNAAVAAVLAAKCEGINGLFRCEALIDLDTTKVKKYTDCLTVKKENALQDAHLIILWPDLKIGEKRYAFSAIYGALIAHTDAENDDVPNLSPSNLLLQVDGSVLTDGTEVVLDQEQANTLNGQGIVTALNDGGWRAWGNNTACYPEQTDGKDRWISSRRFFSWWSNFFILSYKARVDSPANYKLIEAICDSENIRGNSYVAQGKCAGARIEFREEDNPIDGLLNGKLVFRQHLAPYTPAEDILNILAFDPDMLTSVLGGE